METLPRFAQGPISPRPAHSPTDKPRRLGVAAPTTPPFRARHPNRMHEHY